MDATTYQVWKAYAWDGPRDQRVTGQGYFALVASLPRRRDAVRLAAALLQDPAVQAVCVREARAP